MSTNGQFNASRKNRPPVFNFFYPFTNNSPANQACGVLEVVRHHFPAARILTWNFWGRPQQPDFNPPLEADINFFFDMSFRFFKEGAQLLRSLKGSVIYGSITPYLGVGTQVKWDEVDYQIVVGEVPPAQDKLVQVGYFLPQQLLEPAKPELPLALIDHWRRGHPEDNGGDLECTTDHTRANYEVIRQVLSDLHIPFVELGKPSQEYSHRQICDLYRRCHFYFLTFFESFGLPILENAVAGSWVIAPTPKWLNEELLRTCPTFFSWDWDRRRLRRKLDAEKRAILRGGTKYVSRWHQVNCEWYENTFNHAARIVAVVEACLDKKGGR